MNPFNLMSKTVQLLRRYFAMTREKIFFVPFFLLAVCLGLASAYRGAPANVQEAINLLEKRLEHVEGIKVHFYQAIYRKDRKKPILGEGYAWFMRPFYMRWEYNSPEKQTIVADAKKVFLWEPGPNQVLVFKREHFVPGELGKVFFPSYQAIQKDFKLSLVEAKDGIFRLKCIPRIEMGGLASMEIVVSNKDRFIKEVVFYDHLGTKTRIEFKDVMLNPEVSRGMFEFKAPKGAKVFYQD